MPMGMADIATVLWTKFLKHNPKNPNWINRDRFVVSNGHGSMLLYSLLHLSGYDVSIDDIKDFRQLHSKTPGHPEYGYTPGVETTTGPLGQGIANAVGMALGEKLLSDRYNSEDKKVIDHHTYVFLGDGCLMEGVSHEACSLAGTLGLGKLIAFWDDNNISIDGDTKGWFTDNTVERFKAYGWNVIEAVDGHDMSEIEQAIVKAQSETNKPTLICCKTTDEGANYLSYGVREFGMAAIMNGLSLYGGLKPYGGTFLVFSDYSRNAIRMSALMKQPVVHVMSHDSIGLGEDGPTHQPVEHVPSLRLIPNLNVWRPADAVETMVAWQEAIKSSDTPSVMVLTRQGLTPCVDSLEKAANVAKGGYLVSEHKDAKITLVATGSEVELAVTTAKEYAQKGVDINVVSIPCVEEFEKQSQDYKDKVIRQDIPAVFVELAQGDMWYKHMPKAGGEVKGMTTFGESAPINDLMKYFGFTVEDLSKIVAKYL
ncbi:UNVERIFIED_CONTAM: hypothetical protein GTU68_044536 [Idotea baltica]|nr:hypothetical protein [Idotea baltica]